MAASKKTSPAPTRSGGRKFVVIGLIALVALIGGALWLSQSQSGLIRSWTGYSNDSPTAAYIRLYEAVKSKDIERIKLAMTKKSHDLAAMAAARNNTPVEKVFENGFTATTFSETLPMMRDERVKDDMGAVEVWNSKESRWEDLPFIYEEGAWKLAIGDLFADTYKSPGRGLDFREREAANAVGGGAIPVNTPGVNINAVNVDRPATRANSK